MAEKLLVTRVERAIQKTRLQEKKEIASKLILKQWATAEIAETVGIKPSSVEALRRKITAATQP